MALITITREELKDGQPPSNEQAHSWCEQLESGDILFFPETPIPLDSKDLTFLLGMHQLDSSVHKNIAYKPKNDKLSGAETTTTDASAESRLHNVMRDYSESVVKFLTGFLSPYHANWKVDYASFRPQEERARKLPFRRRNDLLHTDAFPTRPTHGRRILRFFNNIHTENTRDWAVGEPFETLIKQFVPSQIQVRPGNGLSHAAKAVARGFGLGAAFPALKRTPYDSFMMRFHNFLKENEDYQHGRFRTPHDFPAGSSWMVYTDMVPHAVFAGRYALEQTLLVAPEAMIAPEHSPLKVLEGIAGKALV